MEVKVCSYSREDAYGLYNNDNIRFVLTDNSGGELLISTDAIDPLSIIHGRLIANGIVKRGDNIFDLEWGELRPTNDQVDFLTNEVKRRIEDFFIGLHLHDTNRPDQPSDVTDLNYYLGEIRALPLYKKDFFELSGHAFSSEHIENETVKPPGRLKGDIEGAIVTNEGEIILSKNLEIVINSMVENDPLLQSISNSGNSYMARLVALCKPLFINILRKIKAVRVIDFNKLKEKLGE